MNLGDFLEGKEERNNLGTFYFVELNSSQVNAKKLSSFLKSRSHHVTPQILEKAFKESPKISRVSPDEILFADIESCGLSGRDPIFLISYGYMNGGEFSVASLLARDYSEEGPIIRQFLEVLHNSPVVVTFNGNSFDLSRISKRARNQGLAINGFRSRDLSEVLGSRHIDLRHHYNGSLQVVEKRVFGYVRMGDVSGKNIPTIYDQYVYKRGEIDETELKMKHIITHNVIDTISLGAALTHCCEKASQGKSTHNL